MSNMLFLRIERGRERPTDRQIDRQTDRGMNRQMGQGTNVWALLESEQRGTSIKCTSSDQHTLSFSLSLCLSVRLSVCLSRSISDGLTQPRPPALWQL